MNVSFVNRCAGYDGVSYFCRHCGKAGFKSEMAVIGHQRVCAQVQIGQGSVGAGGCGGDAQFHIEQGLRCSVSSAPPPPPPPPKLILSGATTTNIPGNGGVPADVYRWMQDMSNQVNRLNQTVYNELPHRMAVAQHDDMKWVKWLLVAYVALYFLTRFGEGDTTRKAVGKLGDRALSKTVDKMLDGLF